MQKLLENLPKIQITPKFFRNLPDSPGVYVYYKENDVIYIGKAINLKRRVASYFNLDLEPKTAKMISEANYLSFIQVVSELEALLLEAKLIRKYMPRYNIAAKDDKHPLYIQITKDKYPIIKTVRKADLNGKIAIAVYGPFPSGRSVKAVLRLIRRIFPYSDHKLGTRPCLYSHIGLCDPCPNIIEGNPASSELTKKYFKNIRHIKSILNGNISAVVKSLSREMESLAGHQEFEAAADVRNKINQLEYITRPRISIDSYLENPNFYEDTLQKELKQLTALLSLKNVEVPSLNRIECFDIAHLAGTNTTASMVTFIGGEPEKKYYRHFRIRRPGRGDDYGALGEVVRRRANHIGDWGKPDLIIVDGGTGQVNIVTQVLRSCGVGVVVIGIAKHPDRLIIGREKIRLTGAALNLVSRMRDEAHRFARRYHHGLISRSIRHANSD